MSSRALRKLQKEQELEKQLALVRAAEAEHEEEDEGEEFSELLQPSKPMNAFDMLEDANAGDSDEDEQDEDPAPEQKVANSEIQPNSTPSEFSKIKRKKRKSKRKAKEKAGEPPTTQVKEADMDEIDRALKELSTKDGQRWQEATHDEDANIADSTSATGSRLLGIDTKHLNPLNEMKSLFGNIALEGSSDSRSNTRNPRRREHNQTQQGGMDLETALTGRNSPASKRRDLGALANRRNVFMQGKEEWPLATSGGLSMERTSDLSTSDKKYSIVHNAVYQETQREFRVCVETMDPQNMISLLVTNPYHVSSLLQVSEIAKHQGDHSVSGDLLERALFTFGRSVHSTFPVALREGTARLAFERAENRELYLSIWRYIKNLEMRGTWQTSFEWAKVLLQLDPRSDPYGVTMMIDQLALRGRKHAAFIEMSSDEAYGPEWAHLPNIQISLALAYLRSAQPKLARQALAVAMHKYPYVLSMLASALDIEPLPTSLWGKSPSTDAEKLYTELYITQAKDLWNTPETTSFLAEVADTLDHYTATIKASAPAPKLEISLEEARHIMLLEIPHLIALLPRHFTNMRTSSSDVLPPPPTSANSDFTARAPANGQRRGGLETIINVAGATAGARVITVNELLSRVMNWFSRPAGPDDELNENGETGGQAAYRELNDALGGDYPPHVIQQILAQSMPDALRNDTDSVDENFGSGPLFATGPSRGIGDFDYYLERANAPSDDEDDDGEDAESMPDLQSIPSSPRLLAEPEARNPHAATVEEDEDNADTAIERNARSAGLSVLRHVDSEDDDEGDFSHALGQQSTPPQRQRATPQTPPLLTTASGFDQMDPQRVQRWLISTGLTKLKSNPDSLPEYVSKLRLLRKQQQDWIVGMVKQMAGAEIAERITSRLGS